MDNIENVSFEPAPTDKFPLCPYCKHILDIIWVKTDGLGYKGQRELCMCPYCEAFLAYSAWKR